MGVRVGGVNNLDETRVRVRSCSTLSRQKRVCVRANTNEHERTTVFALYVFVFFHPWTKVKVHGLKTLTVYE